MEIWSIKKLILVLRIHVQFFNNYILQKLNYVSYCPYVFDKNETSGLFLYTAEQPKKKLINTLYKTIIAK